VCSSLGMGGVEKNVQTIAEAMPREVFEVSVCATDCWGARGENLARKGFQTTCLEGDIGSIRGVLKDIDPHIMMIHRAGGRERKWDTILRAGNNHRRTIVEHNVFGIPDTGPTDGLIDLHLHKSMTSYLKFQRLARDRNYERINRHAVLYNLLDIKEIQRVETTELARVQTRMNCGIKEGEVLFLRVGRSDLAKWGDMLTFALPHIIELVPNARFLFVGVPSSRRAYFQRRFGERVLCLNDTISDDKLMSLYRSADILLHSSRIGESFGYSIAEGMACGLPVIVNSTPWADNAQIELVDHMRTGIVANTPRGMAEAAGYIARNKDTRMVMGEAGAARRDWDAGRGSESLGRYVLDLLAQKGEDVTDLYHIARNWVVSPSKEDVGQYVESYAQRLKRVWNAIPPSRSAIGPAFSRARWFAFDATHIAFGRLSRAFSKPACSQSHVGT